MSFEVGADTDISVAFTIVNGRAGAIRMLSQLQVFGPHPGVVQSLNGV